MNYDVVILGAGAAGMMCAIEAAKRGRRVLLLEKSNKPGRKILMSGGGRCNFTNLHSHSSCYLSHNTHFIKSALARYTQRDFIEFIQRHRIPYHEKTLGQLFCDHKASDIVEALLKEMKQHKVELQCNVNTLSIEKNQHSFRIQTDKNTYHSPHLVIATGGLSIPSMGSNPFAYHIAEQFGLAIQTTRAALVPLTWHIEDKERFSSLAGVSVEATVSCNNTSFREGILFTHRGLSGPAILQISSYWLPGDMIEIHLLPTIHLIEILKTSQKTSPKIALRTLLSQYLPVRLIDIFIDSHLLNKKLADLNYTIFREITEQLQAWKVKPNGTEGYRTAEVTLGGIDTHELSSQTMESKKIPGLFFIGECVDVTGWLGGYNFQWAWSSGWAAGQVV